MNKLITFASSMVLSLGMSSMTYAADYNLKIAGWAPPTHGMNAIMWPTLVKMMEEATDGRVTGELKLGLAPPPAMMDLVQDGAADMSIIFHGYQPGRFVANKLIELPGYIGNAEMASVAYWRVYESHLAALKEHRGVKLVALTTHGPGQFHNKADVKSLAEMDGLKTRIGGGVASDVAAELGLVGIRVPAPKVYETLASGAADAVAIPYEGRKSFKLTEVAKNVFEMPGGFYRGSFAIIMNEDTYNDMPKDIQEALTSKVFGERTSRMLGAAWDTVDEVGIEATKATADNTIRIASKNDQAKFKAITDKVKVKVFKELNDAGIEANTAYEMVKAEMVAL
jgi:TRAP-type C4-dicarboxylate transport system substrate-binding protein